MHPAREAKTAGLSRGSFVHPYSTPLGQLGSTGAMCRMPEVRVPTLLLRPSTVDLTCPPCGGQDGPGSTNFGDGMVNVRRSDLLVLKIK